MAHWNDLLMAAVDRLYSFLPQPMPGLDRLRKLKLVAHRGVHEAAGVQENTLEAFQLAIDLKLWGIEFDLRWTQDEIPVILHDPEPSRIFPEFDRPLSNCRFSELRERLPQVPRLDEVVKLTHPQLHLFIEAKESLDTATKKQTFQQTLHSLQPVRDFHIMSLEPEIFESFDFLPPQCFLPVAEWNFKKLSDLALQKGWAGLTGHYLLLNSDLVHSHRQQGQVCGTGFINSENLLYRELNRGVEWVFTDRAVSLKAILNKALKS